MWSASKRTKAVAAAAESGRVLAEGAADATARLGEPAAAIDRIQRWRALRIEALVGLEATTVLALIDGTPWDAVAAAYGLSEEEIRARFAPLLSDPPVPSAPIEDAIRLADAWLSACGVDSTEPVARAAAAD